MKKTPAQINREIDAVLNAPRQPNGDTIDEATFRRAYAVVLRRYGKTFQALADFDRAGR